MHSTRRRLLVGFGLTLAGTALRFPSGMAGFARTLHATPQTSACSGPAVERESTPVELVLLASVNAYREERGLRSLVPSPGLMRAARWKAAALAATASGVLTSADLDDATRSWTQRLADCGAPPDASVAETLGQLPGSPDAVAVLQLWLSGDENRRLLDNPAYQAVGVAAVATETHTFWVLDLATGPDEPLVPHTLDRFQPHGSR